MGNSWKLLEEKNESGRDFPFANRQIGIYRPVTSLFLIGRLAYQPKGEENQAFIAQRMPFLETDAVCRRGWIEAFPNLAYHAAIQFSPFTDS